MKEWLDSIKPGMKTLYMSGFNVDVVAHRGILDEGILFLRKPFAPLALARKIREALNRPN